MDGRSGRSLLVGPLFSVLLGLLSLALLLRLLTGLPAVLVGLICLRRLNALDDVSSVAVLWGRRLAVGGMVLGTLGCLLGLLGLLSLILVNVNESSRRASCADQLRRIGQAVDLYHDDRRGVYPGATMDGMDGLEGFAPWLDEPYPKRHRCFAALQPYHERPAPREGGKLPQGRFERLAGQLEPRLPWDAPANRDAVNTSIRGLLCPAHPSFEADRKPALGYYVGITGLGADAVELPLESPRAGFFGYVRRLRTGQDLPNPLPRGTGFIMLATETMIDNGPWAAGDRSTLRGLDLSQRPYLGYERPFGGMHHGGANVLTVDGAVRFHTDRTDPDVLERLATLSE